MQIVIIEEGDDLAYNSEFRPEVIEIIKDKESELRSDKNEAETVI